MKRRILALLSVLPLVAFLLLPVVASWSTSRPWTESSLTLAAGDFIAPEEAIYSTGDSTLFLETVLICRRGKYRLGKLPRCPTGRGVKMEFPLEAAPIGWQLFVLESGKSASIAFLLLLATYATRLLAQALMEAMKATLRRLWRLTRATSFVVGLAVMVALVGGVVSLALAKPPTGGEPPPAGGATAASILKGVTNTATAVTTLINSGTGAALNLVVQSGQPPLTVNDGAGTATGLSADKVDGKDADAFVSATNGKAPDSELLDGKDSTEFLGAASKAADSDKLDGKDSIEFAAASTGQAFFSEGTTTVDKLITKKA